MTSAIFCFAKHMCINVRYPDDTLSTQGPMAAIDKLSTS